MKTEIYTNEIPNIFLEFKNLVGDDHWRKRVKLIKSAIRGNPFLKNYLTEENSIAFGLDLCTDLTQKYGEIPVHMTDDYHLIYPSISFAAQILSIIEQSSPAQKQQLVRRVHGALKNPEDMRALEFELLVATHFSKRGNSVYWQEADGTGTTDFVIKNFGLSELEVECKLISHDKGRKIHRREALEFHHFLAPKLKSIVDNLRVGLAVVLTVDGRLPAMQKDKKLLANDVLKNLLTGQEITKLNNASLRVSEFDMSLLKEVDAKGTPIVSRELFDQITQTNNREAMIVGQKSGGAVVLVVQSLNDDTLLSYVFDTLAKSADKQFSMNRAGMFLVGLHGIEPEALVRVAEQDFDLTQSSTALRRHVSDFLSSQNRHHVVGVGFLSKTRPQLDNTSYLAWGGSAYVFPNRYSRFWSDDFSGLFNECVG